MARGSEVEVMQPGSMDRRIELRHRALTKNEQNENVETWDITYATVWAGRSDLHGQKRLLAEQFSHDQLTEFTIRYRTDIVLTDRIIDDEGNIFEITNKAELGRRRFLNCLCRAVVK